MSDPVQSWLNNAGRFPLLPKSEIIRLANKRDTCEPGSAAYIKIINKICQHNLKLVPNVVKNYLSKRSKLTMNSELTCDLLQQGYLGLRRAAEKYDTKKGFTFATYAHNWIFQSISRWYNACDRAVYVPEHALSEALYRRKHGKPSGTKSGKIGDEAILAATRTFDVCSLDIKSGEDEEGNTLLDLMSEENRILDKTSQGSEDKALIELKDLMAECGIRPKTQDVVLLYTRRARMSMVAYKMQLTEKHCRALYQRAVRNMKSFVEKKELERAKASAGTMNYNQPQ